MDNSFDYIKTNNGIDTESSYPYYARQLGYCYFKPSSVGATDTGTLWHTCECIYTFYQFSRSSISSYSREQ